jgi:hypothetical protein
VEQRWQWSFQTLKLDSIAIFAAHKIPRMLPIMNVGKEREREERERGRRGKRRVKRRENLNFLPRFPSAQEDIRYQNI